MSGNPKTSYDKREILAFCVHHPTLPRRLPAPPLLMFDRITEIHAEGGAHSHAQCCCFKARSSHSIDVTRSVHAKCAGGQQFAG